MYFASHWSEELRQTIQYDAIHEKIIHREVSQLFRCVGRYFWWDTFYTKK